MKPPVHLPTMPAPLVTATGAMTLYFLALATHPASQWGGKSC